MRQLVRLAGLALGGLMVGQGAAAPWPAPALAPPAPPPARVTAATHPPAWTAVAVGAARGLRLIEPAYTLTLAQGSADLAVQTPAHPGRFTLPIAALVGRGALPAATRFAATADGAELTLATVAGPLGLIATTIVTGSPTFFTVKVLALAGPDPGSAVFFDGGTPQTTMTPVTGGFTPDPSVAPLGRAPTVTVGDTGTRHSEPFAPPPLMVGLDTPVGWVGLGLAGVPNASVISYRPGGGLTVNYPLVQLAGFPDRGAGGRVGSPASPAAPAARGTWLGFPRFVVTVGATAAAALTAYDAALTGLGLARVAFPPGSRPSWWSWPIADTWGQQFLTEGLITRRPLSAAWVRTMVQEWQRRFGLRHFTVVIDHGWASELGSTLPSASFGGLAGMRRLIDQLHAQGLRVVLWWPLWLAQASPTAPRELIDPSAPGFAAATTRAMRVMLGSGPGELDADGLKYDWGYLVPQPTASHFADPADGLGAAALLHYLRLLAQAAWAARPLALIDGGAAAPQFGGLEGMIRLYDALSAQSWSARADIAAEADPDVAIDGDGFLMAASQAAAHVVSSSVYGTPSLYYATRWAAGQAITPTEASALGLVMTVSDQRGQGRPVPQPGGGWTYLVHGWVVARTLDDDQALILYRLAACGRAVAATLVTTAAGSVVVPLAGGTIVTAVSAQPGRAVPVVDRSGSATFAAQPDVTYRLALASGTACPAA
ncbi:MAG TPA: hypothetical protein VNN74_10890 [Candidatus Micrarchaeia archaeon]|nr:hypothetical protein [Candidatus Micrarchaeia archaeon]